MKVEAMHLPSLTLYTPELKKGTRMEMSRAHSTASGERKRKCRLSFKMKEPCIDLQPPEDIMLAIDKCWNQAIDFEFECLSMGEYFKNKFSKPGPKPKFNGGGNKYERLMFLNSFHWMVFFTKKSCS